MKRTSAIAMVVATIALSSCGTGELGEILNALTTEDLAASAEPAVLAAGEVAQELDDFRQAEDAFLVGRTNLDVEAMQLGGELRPDDPKYPLYEAALSVAAGDIEQADKALTEATFRTARQNPDLDSEDELKRETYEGYLLALRDLLQSSDDFDGRDKLLRSYCYGINERYTKFTGEAAVAFLALQVDRSLCTQS